MASLFGNAYSKAATVETAVNAFRETSICPMNETIFTDVDFVASDVIEREIPQIQVHTERNQQTPPPSVSTNTQLSTQPTNENEVEIENINEILPNCSKSFSTVAPTDICPIPKAHQRTESIISCWQHFIQIEITKSNLWCRRHWSDVATL